MLGSMFSIADTNIVLNTIVADVLEEFAAKLEKSKDFDKTLDKMLQDTIKKHKRIIFNGNNYTDEWVKEAEKRGLLNLRTCADAVPLLSSEENIKLFTKHHIFSKEELLSRTEILLENYCKVLHIEAVAMHDMASRDILPAVLAYTKQLTDAAVSKKAIGIDIKSDADVIIAKELTVISNGMLKDIDSLSKVTKTAAATADTLKQAEYYRDKVLPAMASLRKKADEAELKVGKDFWPYPTYAEMLFSV